MRLDAAALAPPGIVLRPVQPSDDALLKSLYRSVREPELARTGWSEAQKDDFALSQFALQDRWYRENYAGLSMFVIERGGEGIGRIYLHAPGTVVNLMEITLAPHARGQGIGTAILERLQAQARGQDAGIVLYVETYNPARKLYQRHGFEDDGLEGVYLKMRWTPR